MLEAIYHTRIIKVLSEPEVEASTVTYEIATDELPEGFTYRILAYAKTGCYTLTIWDYGDGEESINGETLWYKDKPILSGGGQLALYVDDRPDEKRNSPKLTVNIWEQSDRGEISVPDSVGKSLRSNLIALF